MADLQFESNEELLLKCTGVQWVSETEQVNQYFDILVLTNKRICGTYKKSNGLFKKASNEIMELRLPDIKIINGQPIVSKKWDFNTLSWLLEIQTNRGMQTLSFRESAKKNSALWESEIHKAFGLLPLESTIKSSPFGEFVASLKDVAGSVLGKTSANQASSKDSRWGSASVADEYVAQQSSEIPLIQGTPSGKTAFCSNCGAKLDANAKFCYNCGAAVSKQSQATPQMTTAGTYTSRFQEFVGRIIKCPNCGQPINNTDVVCPACGHQVTDRAASSSVQRLVSELMAIENSRRQKNALDDLVQSFTGTGSEETEISSKKVTLIKNFPIPNTIEEILEFIILAAGNIDVGLSKVSLGNKFGRSGNDFKANERGISDAWVGKLQQAYQKAELMFPDMPIFKKIQEIYTSKMRELNMLK